MLVNYLEYQEKKPNTGATPNSRSNEEEK